MRIAFLTNEFVESNKHGGGLANYVHKTSHLLSERGHDVTVFLLSDRDVKWKEDKVHIQQLKKVQIPSWLKKNSLGKPYSPLLEQFLSSRRLARTLWKEHQQRAFSLIHTSNIGGVGLALLQNHKVPVVCRVSSYRPLNRSAFGRKRSFADYLSDWFELQHVLRADLAFAPSLFVSRAFERFEGLQLPVVRTPVDTRITQYDSSFWEEHLHGRPYLLYFGTLNRIKGADLLTDAAANILEQHQDLHVVFIGRDDHLPDRSKVVDYIHQTLKRHSDRVQCFAPISKAQLMPVVANALAVVMPSRVDNYPNACLEAFAMGTPVVGTANSSLEELITDGETGFLASEKSPTAIAEAIERCLAVSTDERQRIKSNITKQMQRIHQEDRITQLLDCYENMRQRFQKDRGKTGSPQA